MSSACDNEKSFCWNDCEDKLHDCIERSKFVKEVRKKLTKKKYQKKFRS